MKYNLLLFKNLFFKKILKFYILWFILILVYLTIDFKAADCHLLVLGLNKIVFYDQIRDLIKVIGIVTVIYSTISFYFYDFYRNAEFMLLREKSNKYLFKKILAILIYNILIKALLLVVICIIFHQTLSINYIILGIINITLITLMTISLVNFYARQNYIITILIIIMFGYNLFFQISSIIFGIAIIILLLLLNYFYYSTQKVYNKFIR